jgi:hypothetical protein
MTPILPGSCDVTRGRPGAASPRGCRALTGRSIRSVAWGARTAVAVLAVLAAVGCSHSDEPSTPTTSTTTTPLPTAARLAAFQTWAGDSGRPGNSDTSWQGPWLERFNIDDTVIVAVLSPIDPEFDNPADTQAEFARSVCDGMSHYLTDGPAAADGVSGIRVDSTDGQPLLARNVGEPACGPATS